MNNLKLTNENYCGTVISISKLIKLENCNNIQSTIIMGNNVIVGKDVKVGDIGIYFPVECKLSNEFLKENNLYRDSTLNKDNSKKGYFELNGRIRCQKLRGHDSEGLFLPLESCDYIFKSKGKKNYLGLHQLKSFNEIEGVEIVSKYVIKNNNLLSVNNGTSNQKRKVKKKNIVDKQFNFHINTPQLGNNIFKIDQKDIIHISQKLHGTSAIFSNILVRKEEKFYHKLIKFIGKIFNEKTEFLKYDNIYSSRSVIKNDNENPGFYKDCVWSEANKNIKDILQKGMTIYAEILGYTKNGGMIQKNYDYGCVKPIILTDGAISHLNEVQYKIRVYRITMTNPDGFVTEYSPKMVEEFCEKYGLIPVPVLYHGTVEEFMKKHNLDLSSITWRQDFMLKLKEVYLEKKCNLCVFDVPDEGIVIRKESLSIEVFKYKSTLFKEWETKLLDSNEEDIESAN